MTFHPNTSLFGRKIDICLYDEADVISNKVHTTGTIVDWPNPFTVIVTDAQGKRRTFETGESTNFYVPKRGKIRMDFAYEIVPKARKTKAAKQNIVVSVPIEHRMAASGLSDRDVRNNKYDLAQRIASRHHRGSVQGGGTAIGSGTYEIEIVMPAAKVPAFLAELKTNRIRAKDVGAYEPE